MSNNKIIINQALTSASNHELRIVLLIEDTSCSKKITPELGLSIYIEFNNTKGLYDVGQTSKLISNASKMKINLDDLDWVAISHGHYDHTGGLINILDIKPKSIKIFAGLTTFDSKFASRDNTKFRKISSDFSKKEIVEKSFDLFEAKGKTEILENVFLVGPAPLIENYEKPSEFMFIKDSKDNYINDTVEDERTLVIRTTKGLVIITGCAHRGPINITKDVMSQFPDEKVIMVLGGFHLGETSEEIIQKTINTFNELGIENIGLCHCTGERACKIFKENLSEKCFIAHSGSEILV